MRVCIFVVFFSFCVFVLSEKKDKKSFWDDVIVNLEEEEDIENDFGNADEYDDFVDERDDRKLIPVDLGVDIDIDFDDEFDIIDEESENKKQKKEEEAAKRPPVKFFNWPNQEHYYLEILLGVLLCVYLINFVLGTAKNKNIAERWRTLVQSHLLTQFSEVYRYGRVTMHKNSASEYIFHSSGRENVKGLLVTLNLAPRHDMLKYIYSMLTNSNQDYLTMDFAMGDGAMGPFVAALVKDSEAEVFVKEHQDLKIFCYEKGDGKNAGMFSMRGMSGGWNVLTDAPKYSEVVLSPSIVRRFNENVELLKYVHFSDFTFTMFPNERKTMRFAYVIPSDILSGNENARKLRDLHTLAFDVVDFVASNRMAKFAPGERARNGGIREDIVKEEARKLREEKAKKKEEEREKKGVTATKTKTKKKKKRKRGGKKKEPAAALVEKADEMPEKRKGDIVEIIDDDDDDDEVEEEEEGESDEVPDLQPVMGEGVEGEKEEKMEKKKEEKKKKKKKKKKRKNYYLT